LPKQMWNTAIEALSAASRGVPAPTSSRIKSPRLWPQTWIR
jgi:hypothetical protein